MSTMHGRGDELSITWGGPAEVLTWLLSKVRVARIVRGLQDEDNWTTWHLMAGERGQHGEICTAQVLDWSDSLRYRALETFIVVARDQGYHVHPDDLEAFGARLDLTKPMPRQAGGARH